jgi:hypothetical protein
MNIKSTKPDLIYKNRLKRNESSLKFVESVTTTFLSTAQFQPFELNGSLNDKLKLNVFMLIVDSLHKTVSFYHSKFTIFQSIFMFHNFKRIFFLKGIQKRDRKLVQTNRGRS